MVITVSVPLIRIGDDYLYGRNHGTDYAAMTGAELAAYTGCQLAWTQILPDQVLVNKVRSGTVRVEHAIEECSTAEFEVLDDDASLTFEHGQEIVLRDIDDGTIVFGGLIVKPKERLFSPITGALLHTIEATDYHQLAEGRVFWGAYVSATGGDIVRAILAILATEGVTEGQIQEGEILENQQFNYCSASEALDKVAELCGFIWFISEEKKLYFIDRSAYAATWHIQDGSEVLWDTVSVERGNPEYRNVQYMVGGAAQTSPITEPFAGNGVSKSWAVGYPIAATPTVTVNGVAKTVGIGQVDAGKDFYWNEGVNSFYQDATGTPLTADDVCEITYVGQFKLITKVEQAAAITQRKILMGFGTGRFERLTSDSSLVSRDAAIEAAQARLLNYGTVGCVLNYDTFTPGLACGVLQSVNLPVHRINDDMLISNISVQFGHARTKYSVRALLGPVEESWQKFFCGLAAAARATQQSQASEAGTVQGLESFTKTWQSADRPNPFIDMFPGCAVSDTDFPCFASADRLSHVVLYSGGVEFFRKAITLQTIAADSIETTCIIMAEEANGVAISHVGLWGGDNCTTTAGSGIEIEKHVYVKTKSPLESIQLDFTDNKGW